MTNTTIKIVNVVEQIGNLESRLENRYTRILKQQIIQLISSFDQVAAQTISGKLNPKINHARQITHDTPNPYPPKDIPKFMSDYYSKKENK